MRRIMILILIIFIPAVSGAQNPKMEKFNNFKIGFFTKKLDLSSSEAEKFWPVYNEYQNQRNQVQLEKVKINRTFNQGQNSLTDTQLTEMGDRYADFMVQETSLAVAFHKKLKEVLPPAKVIRYYQAEVQYKAELLNELQNFRQQQGSKAKRNF